MSKIPINILTRIRHEAREMWPDERDEQNRYIKQEQKAYEQIMNFDYASIPEECAASIQKAAEQECDTYVDQAEFIQRRSKHTNP